MYKHLPLLTLAFLLATASVADATSANGTRSGSSFGAGSPSRAASGGTSADGSASGNSFGSATIGTDRINSDDDSDGVEDAQDTAPKDNTSGGLNDIDTDNDGTVDANDPEPTDNVDTTDGQPDTDNDGSADPVDPTPSGSVENTTGTGATGTTGNDQTGSADTDDSNTVDFRLNAETNLPNPNHPDPRVNNGTTADDHLVPTNQNKGD